MTYELDGKDYTDVVTKDYYYTAYLNRGAVLLNTYNFHQKYAYNFEISNNKVEIRGQAYSEDYSSQELTSLDSANKFLNFDENENIFPSFTSSLLTHCFFFRAFFEEQYSQGLFFPHIS